ncbi:MAG TPA: hypothetical protein VFM18_07400 [Methanosarcina sp.]|nr:hypothetical protein [Methanosarcina sp.]
MKKPILQIAEEVIVGTAYCILQVVIAIGIAIDDLGRSMDRPRQHVHTPSRRCDRYKDYVKQLAQRSKPCRANFKTGEDV